MEEQQHLGSFEVLSSAKPQVESSKISTVIA